MAIRFLSSEFIEGNLGVGITPATILHLYKNSASTLEALFENDGTGSSGLTLRTDANTNGDTVGFLNFDANSSTSGNTRYGKIRTLIESNTQGAQYGKMVFTTIYSGNDVDHLTFSNTGANFGVNTTVDGTLTLAATKKLQYADDKIIIGNTNSTLGNEAISLGYDADSTGNQSIGIGYNPEASGTYSVAIGYNVTASGTSTFVFGTSGSHSDNNTLVASGLDLKVTGTGTSTFAGNVSGVTASFGSGTSRFTDTSAYPLQLNRGLAVDTVGAAGVILGLGSYSTGTTYVDAVRIVGVLEGNGTNGDMQLQVLNSGSYTNALTLNNNNDATFAGDVTINGTITLGTASFVGTVAGQTVVSSEGAYASSGSVKLYEAKRSGGAVGGDWSYDDATTDMSLGTNTNHAFSLKTNNTRRLTISNDGEIRVAGQTIVKGSNSKYNMTFPDNGGIAIGSAYTFGNIYGSSGNLYLRANSYPANTGSDATINFQTGNSSGGQADDVVIKSGNVGIGTASPGTKLDIVGTSSGSITNLMRIQNPVNSAGTGHGSSLILHSTTDSNRGVAIASSSATNYATNNNMLFYTSSSSTLYERMRIDSNGQVGIGTTSPSAKLQVTDGELLQGNTADGQPVTGRALRLSGQGVYGGAGAGPYSQYGSMIFNASTQYTGGAKRYMITNGYLGNSLAFIRSANATTDPALAGNSATVSSGSVSYYIAGTGDNIFLENVGIGTTSPAEKLDVAGKVQVTGTSLTIINASDPVVTVSDTDTNYRGSMRWLSSSNVLEFFTRYAGTYYTNNLVLDRGNVGIGTTAIPTNGYTASGGGWKMLQIGQSSQIAAYGTDDEIGIFQNTYLNTSGVFQAITSDVAGSSIILVDGKIYFKNASTSGTTQTTSTRMFINTDGNVGIGTTSPVARVDSLSDDGLNKSNNGVKTGRMQYSWYMGKSFTNNDAYVHIKTNLWMGGSPAGNTQYIMGGFTAKSYGYGDGYGEGSCMFHNWNGGFPNLNVTNRGGWATFMQNPYTSTDGYCVIVLRHDYYSTPIIDFQQSYTGYPWRQVTVTATSTSANATGVY